MPWMGRAANSLGVSPFRLVCGLSEVSSVLHSLMIYLASARLAKRSSLEHSSRSRPLKLSMKPFWVGLPGAM
jgi:hypothetical protein